MKWRFWKKPEPPKDARIWNEDWQIGDLALCVSKFDEWHPDMPPWERLPEGATYKITGFSEEYSEKYHTIAYFLHFQEVRGGYSTTAFRKIRPIEDKESSVADRILKALAGPDVVRPKETNPI